MLGVIGQVSRQSSCARDAPDMAKQWTGRPLSDGHAHLSGMTISRSLVSTTKMAKSLAGSVLLALWLTW
jgi:hypothetical protein